MTGRGFVPRGTFRRIVTKPVTLNSRFSDGGLRDFLNELPHGSGIDSDWTYDWRNDNTLVLYNSFHHMNENGMYDGWLDFHVVIGYANGAIRWNVVVDSRRRAADGLVDYLYDTLSEAVDDILSYATPEKK